MILHPTVVIGLGSTGKHVVANAQKYLYEVLNGEQLKLFRFIVLETAVNEHDQGWTAAGVHTKPIDIKVTDIGAVYYTLKQDLKDEFDWCPPDMHINGPGAGNKRTGGRLMLFHHMDKVEGIIQHAIGEVTGAAIDDQTTRDVNSLLEDRGGNQQPHPLPNTPLPVLMVVGTLTGGTCSGACVDLGYLLHRIAPHSSREAIFFLPDSSAITTFKANTWAALSDLMYFTEHPKDYRVVWQTTGRVRRFYSEGDQPGPMPPYKHIYLVTQRDRGGNAHLQYRDDPGSPLLMMEGLYVAANLLGLHDIRQTRLVDLNTRVGENPIFNTFLTHSMRGVSYPKYEISEAAACTIIANHVCEYWLSKTACWNRGRREELQHEEINKRGREFWNAKCQPIWEGLRGKTDLPEIARRIRTGQITDVEKYLHSELTESRDGTLLRSIDQNVESRRRGLQEAIRAEFVEVLSQKQNLQYAQYFLDGIQAEIKVTREYWEHLKTPGGDNDMPAWQRTAGKLVAQLVSRYKQLSPNMLGQRLNVIEDQLEQVVTRLEMFLMYKVLGDVRAWIDSELDAIAVAKRTLLTDVQNYALTRSSMISHSLQDRSGPLLKISRSERSGFEAEIGALATVLPSIEDVKFIEYVNGKFSGVLFLIGQAGVPPRDRLFSELVDKIQPELIKQLQKGGSIDIVSEIEHQQVSPQAAQRAHATQNLSLSTRHELMTGHDNVPSLLLTKSAASSSHLEQLLRNSDGSFPVLSRGELPLFDHMALFYQEGGKFDLNSLLYRDEFRSAYEEVHKVDEAIVDPLRLLKKYQPGREA